MIIKNNALAINSILIAICVTIIGLILHESAHFITAGYFNLNPELHSNYVKLGRTTNESKIVIIASAGPFFSLIFGLLLTYISTNFIRASLLKLFTLWLGAENLIIFFGYILIAPFVKNGDTGKVFEYLGIPTYASIVIAIIFYVLIKWLFAKFSVEFRFYKNEDQFNLKENGLQLFIYPIFASVLTMTLLSLPIANWIIILPTTLMPLSYLITFKAYKKLKINSPQIKINKISKLLIVLTILLIILFKYLR
ncbi:hypothetical protein [Pedobacter nototheniae]|uniref:hypothetical protein n=1 Tax=Pedobacter nototheniae TaxID=2488994 RepID=UPI00103A7588|nr:hypothetical protein [Pedobacter nototheniae]